MNKTTFSQYGAIIATVIILAIMVAFSTPLGDHIVDSIGQSISTFGNKSKTQLSAAKSKDYSQVGVRNNDPDVRSIIANATNQGEQQLKCETVEVVDPALLGKLLAFTHGAVEETNVLNAKVFDVSVEGEFSEATIDFDVAGIANNGDQVAIYHFDEYNGEWECITSQGVDDDRRISATFTSLSPIAIVNLSNGFTEAPLKSRDKYDLSSSSVALTGIAKVSSYAVLQEYMELYFVIRDIADGIKVEDLKVMYSFSGSIYPQSNVLIRGSDWVETSPGSGEYSFLVAKCSGKEITDDLNFYLYHNDEIVKSIEGYTFRQYCVDKINEDSDHNLAELFRAVLDFGAECQKYFKYNENKPANAGGYGLLTRATSIPDEWKAGSASKSSNVKASASIGIYGLGVVHFYFYFSDGSNFNGIADDDIAVTIDGEVADSALYSWEIVKATGRLLITPKMPTPVYMGKIYGFSFETDAGYGYMPKYTTLSYAYSKQNSASIGPLCLSLYNYYLCALAYYGAIPD